MTFRVDPDFGEHQRSSSAAQPVGNVVKVAAAGGVVSAGIVGGGLHADTTVTAQSV